MAAKLLHSLTDDNPDLQKQIGCMTGIFQLFDRQNMLTGSRRIVGHTPKRLPHGNSHYNVGTSERESSNAYQRSSSREKYSHKNIQDRQRVSTESSRASFSSSSRSSSFSSLDCNRATQLEPASFDRMIFPETPSRDPAMTLQNSSTQFTRQSVDLRDFVKESIYKEMHGLSSNKPKTTEDTKHKDSPRLLHSKYTDNSYNHEPRELLRSSSYHAREGSSYSAVKDAPRFSYDGREINRTRFDGSNYNTTLKLKDLPRLSLDSREGSMRNLTSDSRSNIFLKTMQKDSGIFDNPQQQTQARPPSVVAKLMGLETLPEPISSNVSNMGSGRSYPDEEFVNNLGLSEKIDMNKPMQKNSWTEPSSPRWRNSDGSMKPMPRSPIEPAPWKQSDGARGISVKSTRNQAKGPTAFPSVYSEIEKRLKDIEFTQSGKDLRALKQILESMHAKGLLETPQEGQGCNFTTHNDQEEKNRKPQTRKTNKPVYAETYESPIVIMKPAKLVSKSGIPASSVISLEGISGIPKFRGSESVDSRKSRTTSKDFVVKSINTKSDRTSSRTAAHTPTKSQPLIKEGNQGWGKSTGGSISPRMQHKKIEMEKRSRPPTSPDSNKSKRLTNKQQSESSNSPGGRRRLKNNPNAQQSDDQVSEVSVESAEIADMDSYDRPAGVSGGQSPSKKSSQFMKSRMNLSEEESSELGAVPLEYSSPVSVLDTVEYNQDSPVKYVGKSLKVDISTGNHRNPNEDAFVSNSSESSSKKFENNRKKLQNIDNLVQKLRRLNSSHDEARTDYIASLCENTNPDDRYISEILLASGLLLRDLTEFQFHQSGHPINPELFLVLEQTKGSTISSKEEKRTKNKAAQFALKEKFHRKLIFDAVNEILARKFVSVGPNSEPRFFRPYKLTGKALNAQKILRELCCEIEGLQAKKSVKCGSSDEEDGGWKSILWADVMNRSSENWVDFDGEIAGPVLDIERLIFKDLVDEIVLGESAGLITKPVRHKVFAKK